MTMMTSSSDNSVWITDWEPLSEFEPDADKQLRVCRVKMRFGHLRAQMCIILPEKSDGSAPDLSVQDVIQRLSQVSCEPGSDPEKIRNFALDAIRQWKRGG
jgi:hypothetical protein